MLVEQKKGVCVVPLALEAAGAGRVSAGAVLLQWSLAVMFGDAYDEDVRDPPHGMLGHDRSVDRKTLS
jgi:hypothetical protein